MPEKGKKSLPMDNETHLMIKLEATARGIEMSELVRQMWDEYRQRHGTMVELRKPVGANRQAKRMPRQDGEKTPQD